MYFDNAEGPVFRPPSEAESFILRVTIGCSHNACTFCTMYKEVPFRLRTDEEVERQIDNAALFAPDLRRVFLADGNALVLATDKLLAIMNRLNSRFPKLSRITCYGGPKDILGKSTDDLHKLRKAGLAIIYLGMESGDEEVLKAINKGVGSAEMIEAGKRVTECGIKLSTMVILGIGGKAHTHQHAVNSAQAVNAMHPDMLSTLTLMVAPGSKLRQDAVKGLFQPLSPYELVVELGEFIRHIDLPQGKHCLFRSNHVSNLLPLAGTLPKDKERLLADIGHTLPLIQDRRTPTFNDRGSF